MGATIHASSIPIKYASAILEQCQKVTYTKSLFVKNSSLPIKFVFFFCCKIPNKT